MGKERLTQEEVANRISNYFEQDVILISEYINQKSNVTLQCNDCGHIWTTVAKNVIRLDKDVSSHQCPNCGLHKKDRVLVKCAYCGKEIERHPSDVKASKTGLFYCCQEHGNLHKNQRRRENGEWCNSLNYRARALEALPHYCNVCGWNEDDRILEVHHIDEDRKNNLISNLVILCPTCHRKITLGYYIYDKDNQLLIKK